MTLRILEQPFPGPESSDGLTGAQGYQGSQGFQGNQGFVGVDGHDGNAGVQGFQGNQGTAGTTVISAMAGTQAITSTSLVDISGLTLALTSGTWIYDAVINGNCATGTNGCQVGVQYSGTTTSVDHTQFGNQSTVLIRSGRVTAKNTPGPTYMQVSAAECMIRVRGNIIVSDSGNFTVKGLKLSSQTFNVYASSHVIAIKVA